MNVWRLVLQEIAHRKVNFAMGLLSVAAAVASFVGATTLLQADRIRTDEILSERKQQVEQAVAEKQQEVKQAGKQLENEMRKITKGLGFNLLILPQDQDLNELHAEGTLSKTMPAEYVDRLANSNIMTINHLLPMVTQKFHWEEMDQTIHLVGTRGEVPLAHRDLKKPLQDQVPPGSMVVGYQIHTKNSLRKDQKVTLQGREFTVSKLKPQQGNRDDATAWINLAEAQELLGRQNLVNGILALECNCATQDRVAEIREDVAAILPGTQVIESGPPALARAEARNKAKQTAEESLSREKAAGAAAIDRDTTNRTRLREQREQVAAVLVPLVIVGCAVWIGFLALMNVRQRTSEVGILRAIGLRSVQILTIFLGKAVLIGLIGAVVGYAAGFGFGVAAGELAPAENAWSQLFAPSLLVLALLMAPLLSAVASWIPAVLAAREDPAVILQAE